jgi:hypothetical protein
LPGTAFCFTAPTDWLGWRRARSRKISASELAAHIYETKTKDRGLPNEYLR